MNIQQCYALFGGAYDEVLSRMGGSERLVSRFALKYLSDPTYRQLSDAMNAHDDSEAFRAAHTLKGICLNLGFSSLAASSSALTEALRPGHAQASPQELAALMDTVTRDHEQILAALGQIA